MYKKIFAALIAMFLVTMSLVAISSPANADKDCTPKDAYTEIVVDTPAWTETINHPAVTHTVHHDAVTHVVHHDAVPATPDKWWNWSPNETQGPQDYTPAFPTDSRGEWQGPHENGGPDQDTYGTFNSSNGESGRSSWFHREHGTAAVPAYDETVVDKAAYDEVVVDKAAWTETINHPAVTHEVKHDAVTCDDDEVVPPKDDEPKPPVDKPEPPKVDTPVTAPKPPVKVSTPAVPTAVDAGLASLPNTGAEDRSGLIALVGGMMILVGSVLFFRKRA